MINNVTLEGRLTKDPQLNQTNSGKSVAQFTIAVDRPYRNANGDREADFINVIAWNKTGELVKNYFKRGNGISIQGSIQTRTYDNKNGEKVWVTEVVAREVGFPIQNKEKGPEVSNANQTNSASVSPKNNSQQPKMDDPFSNNDMGIDISESELPF